jgi:hypothetical protein
MNREYASMTTRKSVRDFIDRDILEDASGSNTVLRDRSQAYRAAGYVSLDFSHLSWHERFCLREWASIRYGNDFYNWVGTTFWFNSEEDATVFVLSMPGDIRQWQSNQQTA